jgi:Zn-dependent protease with chaperone function
MTGRHLLGDGPVAAPAVVVPWLWLCARAGVPAPGLRRIDGLGSGASLVTDGRRPTVLYVGDLVEQMPAPALTGMLAHEVGHLALGHQQPAPRWQRAGWALAGAAQLAVAAAAAAGLGRLAGLLAAAVLAGAAGGAWLAGRARQRAEELAADRYSEALVGAEAARAALIYRHHADGADRPDGWWSRLKSTHPQDAARIAAVTGPQAQVIPLRRGTGAGRPS